MKKFSQSVLGRLTIAALGVLILGMLASFVGKALEGKPANASASKASVSQSSTSQSSSGEKKTASSSTQPSSSTVQTLDEESYAEQDASAEGATATAEKVEADKISAGNPIPDPTTMSNPHMRTAFVVGPTEHYAINTSTPEGAAMQELWNASMNAGNLQLLAMQHGYDISHIKSWTQSKNGKLTLSDDAQALLLVISQDFEKHYDFSLVKMDGVQATSAGLDSSGRPIMDENIRDWSGWMALKKVDRRTGKVYYTLLWCGNPLWPKGKEPNIPKKNIPTPQTPPTKKTPPSSSTPKSSTPPPPPVVVQKKAQEAPQAPQGGGQVDGSANTATEMAEPPAEYVAPAAPSAQQGQQTPAPQNSGRGGAGQAPAQGGWTGAGSYTDSRGTTTVHQNGAVTAPDPADNRSSLVDKPTTPVYEDGANSPDPSFEGNGEFTPED